MNCEPTLTSIYRPSAFRLDPTLASEEAIILRALAAGRTDKQVCNEFRVDRATFLRGKRSGRRTTIPSSSGRSGTSKASTKVSTDQKDMHAPRETNEVARLARG
jgi:hypothetical protein